MHFIAMAKPKMLVGPVLHFERHCWLGVDTSTIEVGGWKWSGRAGQA